MNVTRRPASDADRQFAEKTYFDTQRWLIEKLFGWRGDDIEAERFRSHYHQRDTEIISVNGADIGWITVVRSPDSIDLHSIYLAAPWQRLGIGTSLVSRLIDEAKATNKPLTLSTAKANPARRLYERMGFSPIREDRFKVYLVYLT